MIWLISCSFSFYTCRYRQKIVFLSVVAFGCAKVHVLLVVWCHYIDVGMLSG